MSDQRPPSESPKRRREAASQAMMELLTSQEAADLLKVTVRKVRAMSQARQLVFVAVGGGPGMRRGGFTPESVNAAMTKGTGHG